MGDENPRSINKKAKTKILKKLKNTSILHPPSFIPHPPSPPPHSLASEAFLRLECDLHKFLLTSRPIDSENHP